MTTTFFAMAELLNDFGEEERLETESNQEGR